MLQGEYGPFQFGDFAIGRHGFQCFLTGHVVQHFFSVVHPLCRLTGDSLGISRALCGSGGFANRLVRLMMGGLELGFKFGDLVLQRDGGQCNLS